MYHPAIQLYLQEFGYGTAKDVLKQVCDCLNDNTDIMQVNWRAMAFALDFDDLVFSRVYNYGWDYNQNTRKLRKKFEEIAYNLSDKSLEDYL